MRGPGRGPSGLPRPAWLTPAQPGRDVREAAACLRLSHDAFGRMTLPSATRRSASFRDRGAFIASIWSNSTRVERTACQEAETLCGSGFCHRDRLGEGESYMGLFPRTVGKRFSRARTGASWGTHPRSRPPGRGNGRKADARGIMQDPASLSGTTRCGVDWYAFHGIPEAGIPSSALVYARCCIRTSENSPSRTYGE